MQCVFKSIKAHVRIGTELTSHTILPHLFEQISHWRYHLKWEERKTSNSWIKDVVAKSLNRMHFCNLFYQKQKNKNSVVQCTLDYKLDSSVARWKFVWVIVLSKIHLFSANECMPDELPFWSKSELKLAQHKGNFKTAQFRSPELHLLYVFLVQDYNRSGNRQFWVTSMMWCSVQIIHIFMDSSYLSVD